MPDLLPVNPTISVCSYNGVTFGTRTETKSVEIKPIYDSSGRTVQYNLYSLTLESDVFVVGGTTDATLQSLRKLLTHPAGELRYTSKGLGTDLAINVQAGGLLTDCKWGPKPAVLSFKPHGANNYVRISWKVDWAIADCPNPMQQQFGLLEFCYKLTYDIDKSGYTTRTYAGHLAIAQTRKTVNARTLQHSADEYRRFIAPVVPTGFRRLMGPFNLSEDKCRLDWSMKDEQMPPNYLPPGVIDCTADHAISSQGSVAFGGRYHGTLTATYEMALDTPVAKAFQYFFELLAIRMSYAAATPFVGAGAGAGKQVTLIKAFSMRESIYARGSASFSATYLFLSSLSTILKASGLWTPVPNSDWTKWAQSLTNTAFHLRGSARMAFNVADDAILDICYNQQPTTPKNTPALPAVPRNTPPLQPTNPMPPPEVSWEEYLSVLTIEPIDDVVEVKTLPTTPVTITPPPDDGDPSFTEADSVGQQSPTSAGRIPDPTSPGLIGIGRAPRTTRATLQNNQSGGTLVTIPTDNLGFIEAYSGDAGKSKSTVQVRNTPRFRAILTGQAKRIGYGVVSPRLVSVGGVAAIPANREGDGFACAQINTYFGVPVYGAVWRLRYILPGLPAGQVPIMDVPYPGA